MASNPADPPDPGAPRPVTFAQRVRAKADEGVQKAKLALAVVVGDGLGLLGLAVAIVRLYTSRWFRRLPSLPHVVAGSAIVGVPLAGAAALSTWIEAGSTVGVMGTQPGTPVSAVAWNHGGNVAQAPDRTYAAIGTYDGRILIWDHTARRSLATLQTSGAVMALRLFDEGGGSGGPSALRVFARTVGGPEQLQEQLRRLARAIEALAQQKPRDEDVQRVLQMMAMLQQQKPQDEEVQRLQRLVEQQGLQLQPQQQQRLPPNVSAETVPDAADVRTRVMEWIVALDGSVLQSRQLAADGDPATGRYLYVAPARSGSRGGSPGGGTNAPPQVGNFLVLDDRYPSGMSAHALGDKALSGRITAAMLADDGSTLSVLGLDSGHVLVEGERRRVLSALEATGVPVTALAAGPTTQIFFSATAGGNVARHGLAGDGTMQLYGSRPWTLTPGPVLSGHDGPIVADIAADGSRAVTASPDGQMQLWDLRQVPLRPNANPRREPISHLALSDDGSLLLTANQNGSIRAWSLRGDAGFARDLRGHRGAVTHIALSPDRTRAASASDDGNVRVWDLRQDTEPSVVRVGAKVNHVAFDANSRSLVIAAEDGSAHLWNIGAQSVQELEGHRRPVLRVSFSPDVTRILTVAREDGARLWDLRADPPTSTPLVIQGATFLDGVFSPDGTKVAVSAMDGDVWVWDFSGPAPRTFGLKGPGRAAWSPSFGPQGRSLAVGYADGTAALWDLSGAVPRATTLRGHGNAVTQAKVVGDGLTVFTASADGTARLWQVQPTVSAHAAPVVGLHVSVLSGAAEFERRKEQVQPILRRQQALSNELARLDEENRRQQAGAKGDDLDRRLAELQQEMAALNEQVEQFQRDAATPPTEVWSVAENGEAMLWGWRTDVPVAKIEHGSRIAASGVIGGLLFTAGDDGIVRLRDAGTGFLVGTIAGHGAPLTHAAISARARYLLSADAEGVVRITDIGRARWIWRLEGWPDALPSVSTMLDSLTALVRGEGNGEQAGAVDPARQQPAPTGSAPAAK
jgi:WD40 repeat protein